MTRDRKIYRLAYWFASFVLAGTFLAAAYFKITDPAAFASAVAAYRLVPERLVPAFSFAVTAMETACGIGLAVPKLRAAALWTALALLVLFSGAIGINLIRGAAIPCGCFGHVPNADPLNAMYLMRSLMLALLAAMALTARKKAA